MTIHDKIRRVCDERCINRSALSRAAGFRPAAITEMLSKGFEPSSSRALLIARVLGVPVEWLIDDEQGWPPVYVNRTPATTGSVAPPPPNSDAA